MREFLLVVVVQGVDSCEGLGILVYLYRHPGAISQVGGREVGGYGLVIGQYEVAALGGRLDGMVGGERRSHLYHAGIGWCALHLHGITTAALGEHIVHGMPVCSLHVAYLLAGIGGTYAFLQGELFQRRTFQQVAQQREASVYVRRERACRHVALPVKGEDVVLGVEECASRGVVYSQQRAPPLGMPCLVWGVDRHQRLVAVGIVQAHVPASVCIGVAHLEPPYRVGVGGSRVGQP